jgi:hypothetical protein
VDIVKHHASRLRTAAFACVVICALSSAKAQAKGNWTVFYDSEKGAEHLSIPRKASPLAAYTNDFPAWNVDLLEPKAKIKSATLRELGKVGGLRAVEARLSLRDTYYTDMLMILEEVQQGQFLPVYVQIYNRWLRAPSETVVVEDKKSLIVKAGMDYEGTGHFHDHYKITISPTHGAVVASVPGPF